MIDHSIENSLISGNIEQTGKHLRDKIEGTIDSSLDKFDNLYVVDYISRGSTSVGWTIKDQVWKFENDSSIKIISKQESVGINKIAIDSNENILLDRVTFVEKISSDGNRTKKIEYESPNDYPEITELRNVIEAIIQKTNPG